MEHFRAVIKVAFIGAGSIEFTRNVVTDLCGFTELGGSLQLALHDISPERLAFAERLGRQIVAQNGSAAGVHASAGPTRGGSLRPALHDFSPERLAFAERLVRQIVPQTGSAAAVTPSASRTEALD